jgi:hypothetical protein
MSDFIAAEWITPGPSMGIGAILIYNEHDGFKCYVGSQDHVRNNIYPEVERDNSAIEWDIVRIRKYGGKVPVEIAAAFFRHVMVGEFMRRNMWGAKSHKRRDFRYDGHDYVINGGIEEVK